ncbi:MAG TPA: hypothetical protein GX399_08565 [Xanthomonadaceae bacterium]|nr:hypothetical protein [Xanthomonadaceae bacterium]
MTDPIAHNLHVVDRHIRNEAVDVDSVLDLYTDDIVLEVPGRDLRLEAFRSGQSQIEFGL